ncbi:uncharacterized protein HMPREF1120_07948 [Exophiala dermatitidis NIH/UT8656]|uniref:Uncharacterized protein n=1 Tax=Exophiala dermatitidis (strain ATCC 34100 / CBS 525.76 / NIH/UT8656) TaxID=858893 RepID=H6C9X0_EXODN|nr:uncharacterized protein HMPREF1120_07948 [Exophiala dermatitidis NIH/UT8656]EHY59972.1 hypothetical protein HMPREF1120_07948 [Exophiala dermatitidis NIH/UT8656]
MHHACMNHGTQRRGHKLCFPICFCSNACMDGISSLNLGLVRFGLSFHHVQRPKPMGERRLAFRQPSKLQHSKVQISSRSSINPNPFMEISGGSGMFHKHASLLSFSFFFHSLGGPVCCPCRLANEITTFCRIGPWTMVEHLVRLLESRSFRPCIAVGQSTKAPCELIARCHTSCVLTSASCFSCPSYNISNNRSEMKASKAHFITT